MSSWQIIFLLSSMNSGLYTGDTLPARNWEWPRGTWFQTRLRDLRKAAGKYSKELT